MINYPNFSKEYPFFPSSVPDFCEICDKRHTNLTCNPLRRTQTSSAGYCNQANIREERVFLSAKAIHYHHRVFTRDNLKELILEISKRSP